jgi:hypothetical protein
MILNLTSISSGTFTQRAQRFREERRENRASDVAVIKSIDYYDLLILFFDNSLALLCVQLTLRFFARNKIS